MQKSIILAIIAWISYSGPLFSQQGPAKGRALSFPSKKYGISIGNSQEFTGIRINFADRDVRKVNGLNVTFWADEYKSWFNPDQFYNNVVNGVSVGIIPTAGMMRGVNAGVIRVAASKNLSGISGAALNVFANGSINGVSVSGFLTQAGAISGVSASGIAVASTGGISGFVFGGLAVSSDRSDISGVATSVGLIFCGNDFTGIGISGLYLRAGSFKGLAMSGYSRSNQMTGISIALFNSTSKLNGVQIGLINYAGNNRKGLRLLPVMNMHLKDK